MAVADLIAEYIPSRAPAVNPVQEATPSSTTPCSRLLGVEATPGSPKWNTWIQSVGRRFPMADMSVRQVLDVLDSRPETQPEESH